MPSYLVTGAGRGLGYAILKVLAAEPSNTVIGLVRNRKATQERLAADGVTNAHILTSDITDEQGLRLAAEEAGKILRDRGLDVLINNAAYVSDLTALKSLQDFEQNTEGVIVDTQKSFDINVLGVLKTVFAFLPLIKAGTLKKVVAISSGMADIDLINEIKLANAAPYAVSKAALSTLFAKLNAAYEDQGILFISLCPGLVATAEGEKAYSDDDLARLQGINAKFEKYAPSFRAQQPTAAASSVLAAISRSSLAGGSGGSFLSHNGTKRWM
ncbi:NAD(P)-binding protein [Pleurostoma richardsiae]|uniref:NAD(P)-binding protein n=1 Tax=Pleurostoma richardsiae TaxID=41990 RepID=A0AA38VKH0_9PEZI|nr:NAD(P)-binding protein [Pleurostoma richardsiae]